MKLISCLIVVTLFLSASLAWRHPKSILDAIRPRPSSPLWNSVVLANSSSGCGNSTCTQWNDCPSFPFISANCTDGLCEYSPEDETNVCTEPSLCGNSHYCYCPTTLASDGCKCEVNSTCSDSLCYDGICQDTDGFVGDFCQSDQDCNIGVCSKYNLCVLQTNGGDCEENSDCEPTLYCSNDQCTERPLCNATVGNIGFCPGLGICYEGVCIPQWQSEGNNCYQGELQCLPGLACIDSTCQRVPLNTECESNNDCEFFTQQCMCSEPDNSSPQVCTDPGTYICLNEAVALYNCMSEQYCDLFDIYDPSTNCSKKCLPLQYQVVCCMMCLYPEYSANAFPNYEGSCANHTMREVECCSELPCTIIETEQLCAGYHEIRRVSNT